MDIQYLLADSDRTRLDVNSTQEPTTLKSTTPFLPPIINSYSPRSPDIFAPKPSNHQAYHAPSSYYLDKDLRNSLLNSGALIAPWNMNSTSQPKLHVNDEDMEVVEAARILMRMRKDRFATNTVIDADAGANADADADTYAHVEGTITARELQHKESLSLPADSDQTTIAGTPEPEAYFQTPSSPVGFMVELGDVSSYAQALPQSIATRNHMNLMGLRPTPPSTSTSTSFSTQDQSTQYHHQIG